MTIRRTSQIVPGECADQHQQAGLREMEIRYHRIYGQKLVARVE